MKRRDFLKTLSVSAALAGIGTSASLRSVRAFGSTSSCTAGVRSTRP